MRSLVTCAAAFAVAACSSIPQNSGNPAGVSEVVNKIKNDLQVYQRYDAEAEAAKPLDNVCNGSVSFTIDNVQISLTTKTDDTVSGSGSVTLPVGIGTFGPSLGASRELKGTQTLTFSLYPKPPATPVGRASAPGAIDVNQFPIAAALQRLRDGLLDASQHEPCVSLVPIADPSSKDAPKDDGGTFEFGFAVIKEASAGGQVTFVVFSLGAKNTALREASNTMTVTFKARRGGAAAFQ